MTADQQLQAHGLNRAPSRGAGPATTGSICSRGPSSLQATPVSRAQPPTSERSQQPTDNNNHPRADHQYGFGAHNLEGAGSSPIRKADGIRHRDKVDRKRWLGGHRKPTRPSNRQERPADSLLRRRSADRGGGDIVLAKEEHR